MNWIGIQGSYNVTTLVYLGCTFLSRFLVISWCQLLYECVLNSFKHFFSRMWAETFEKYFLTFLRKNNWVQVNLFQKLATCCVPKFFWMSKQKQQFVYTTCSAGILSLQLSWTMNNLSPYCGLVDAKIRASDKDLPVTTNRNLQRYQLRVL